MLNKIWFGLLLVGILYGFGKAAYNDLTGRSAPLEEVAESEAEEQVSEDEALAAEDNKEVVKDAEPEEEKADIRGLKEMGKDLNEAALNAANTSVEICLGLIGVMALWLGLMNIATEAGLVEALGRLLSPVMRWLFPEVPDGHPAQGAMLMNISANMLGLDNAATPLGLKAMQELQTLNPQKDTATNSMATFLAINTSNVTIIPIAIIGYRVAAGSEDPVGPLIPIFLTTCITTIVAIIAVRLLAKSPAYAIPAATEESVSDEEGGQS